MCLFRFCFSDQEDREILFTQVKKEERGSSHMGVGINEKWTVTELHWWTLEASLFSQHSTASVIVQSLSCVRLFVTPWTVARQASPSFTVSWSLLKLMSLESVMPSNHVIFYISHLPLPSIFPSIRIFSDESVLRIRWPEYWSFSFNISPANDSLILIDV